MPIIRGPFNLVWGANTITDVEEIELEHEIDSEDFQTIGGRTLEIDGSYKASATLTLLSSDIEVLAVLLPQHYVAQGETMSTGETVTDEAGAIDYAPLGCTTETIYNNLDIISCGNPAEVTRIVNARTKLEGVELDEKLRKVMIKFIGESAQGEATMQFYKQGGLSDIS